MDSFRFSNYDQPTWNFGIKKKNKNKNKIDVGTPCVNFDNF